MTKLFARICFIYIHEDRSPGRMAYINYDREDFEDLGIPLDDYDGSQFIEIGRKIIVEGYECEIKRVNVKLEPHLFDSGGGNKHNCQIGVFVERMNKVKQD